jgi:hypothetical protein
LSAAQAARRQSTRPGGRRLTLALDSLNSRMKIKVILYILLISILLIWFLSVSGLVFDLVFHEECSNLPIAQYHIKSFVTVTGITALSIIISFVIAVVPFLIYSFFKGKLIFNAYLDISLIIWLILIITLLLSIKLYLSPLVKTPSETCNIGLSNHSFQRTAKSRR